MSNTINANRSPQNWTENYGNTPQGYKNFQNNVDHFKTLDGKDGDPSDKTSDRLSPGGQVFSWDKDANHGDGAWMQRGQVKPDSISKLNKGNEITDNDIQEFSPEEQDKNYGDDFYEAKSKPGSTTNPAASTKPSPGTEDHSNYYEDKTKNWTDNYGNTPEGFKNYQKNIESFRNTDGSAGKEGDRTHQRVGPGGEVYSFNTSANHGTGAWEETGHVKNDAISHLKDGGSISSGDIEDYSNETIRAKNFGDDFNNV